ncbi:MAG TPA: hypothetical protein VMI94_14675 [Bryobacteraceae bacterium]|nr:hypothetical protein [Bryobacteraceae bacterium]
MTILRTFKGMSRGKKFALLAPVAIVAITGFIALGSLIVQQLWNWLLPAIFGWRTITFWQALGILALSRILFGHFGGGGSPQRRSGRGSERWQNMTPEERERFRQGMHERFGCGPSASEPQGQ